MSDCAHKRVRFSFTALDDDLIAGVICVDCGKLVGTGAGYFAEHWCSGCVRPLKTCMDNPCEAREPSAPWQLRRPV